MRLKVDTVSEKTSGSGVTIDGLLIKDGGISGDVSLIGTTPTFTIGDAGAEDAALVFDGNAQDFYIALDDSADDLIIGKGSAVGTTPAVSIDENLQVIVHDNLSLLSDSSVLKFGTDGDTTLTHTDGTGLTLNSTNKICFNDASQFIQGSSATVLSIGATDEIDLTATAVDLNGTLNVSGVATFQATPVFPDGSIAVADLDIDGATDIGAAVVDADLFIIDDGAGGTNRKVTASRLKTYAGGAATIGALTDVTMDATNFVDSILIQTNSDGSAPTTGTLSGASNNVGIGKDVFAALTSGNENSVIGTAAGQSLTTGIGNVFLGLSAGTGITTGDYNVFIGRGAGDGHDAENDNIAIGKDALGGSVAGGEHNVCIGQSAGDAITSADYNIFIGQDTGTAATTGGGNVAVGYNAGSGIVGGINSTLLGISAGAGVTSGGGIIAIGKDAGRTGSPGGNISTASDIVAIGDENIGACHIQTDWTVASDKRDKTDIESIKMGLDFVNKLEPITYRWDKRSKYNKDLNTTPTGEHKENWLDTGF